MNKNIFLTLLLLFPCALFSVAVQAQSSDALEAYSHTLAETVHREHRHVGTVEVARLRSLPVGLTGSMEGNAYLLIWDSARFTPQGASCDLYVHLYLPERQQPLVFARKQCPLLLGDTTLRLPLVSGTAGDQGFVEVNSRGVQRLHLPALPNEAIASLPASRTATGAPSPPLKATKERPLVNFLVASSCKIGDTLLLAEVSLPLPDSVSWQFPAGVRRVESGAITPGLTFSQSGRYALTLTAYYRGRAHRATKIVVVKGENGEDVPPAKDTPPSVIETVVLFPNPNRGQFRVQVTLRQAQPVVLKVIHLTTGREVWRQYYPPATTIEAPVTLSDLRTGSYVLKVITETDRRERFFTIAQ